MEAMAGRILMAHSASRVSAVVFDWAGTTVDFGSLAPVIAFQECFQRRGIPVTTAEAREPMGMAKRDHIAAIAALPRVAAAWLAAHGKPCQDTDIDVLYEDFLPIQMGVLREHSDVIPGVCDTVSACRGMGLKVGSTTGYSRALMEVVSALARGQGYQPDCVICADDAPRGRPAPYLLYAAAQALDVYPLWTVINVDDTPVGVEAGRHAGCWTVGVTRTGNCVGLSAQELSALPEAEVRRLCDTAAQRLLSAGAHYTIECVADIVPIIIDVERRVRRGQSPVSGT
jgi:phosphonoacetaldehyde hydrolase